MSLSNKYYKEHHEEYKVVYFCFKLTKQDVLKALMFDVMVVDGVEYIMPEGQLMNILINRSFGECEIQLTTKSGTQEI